MTQRSRKRLLIFLNVALAAALVGVPAALLLAPPGGDRGGGGKAEANSHSAAAGQALRPLNSYEAIYRRDLRKPLFDPVVVAEVKAPPPKPKLTIRLTGTAVEPGFSYAMFRTAGGQDKLVSVGQTLEGAELTEIRSDGATVRFNDELLQLAIEKGSSP